MGGTSLRPHTALCVSLLVFLCASPPASAETARDRCRELAAHPEEPRIDGPGVADDALNSLKAFHACSAAIREDLFDLPSRFRLARAFWVEGPVQNYSVAKGSLAGCVSVADDQRDMPEEDVAWYRQRCEQLRSEEYLRPLAENGDRRAQMYLTENSGKGGIPDEYPWIRPAAEADYTYAIWYLGYIAQLRQDYPEAARLYEIAARRGLSVAQMTLSALYRNGLGVPLDDAKAEALLVMAAANGQWEAIRYIEEREAAKNRPPPQTEDDYLALLVALGVLVAVDAVVSGGGGEGEGEGGGGGSEIAPGGIFGSGPSCNWGEWPVGDVCVPDPSTW